MLCAAIDCAAMLAAPADRKGGAHFLLIPTRTTSGIESPLLFEPGKDGPRFVLLAGTGLGAELLLDSSCAAAGQMS